MVGKSLKGSFFVRIIKCGGREGDNVPTRPVVSGNRGINTHLSELLSEILEPVTNNMTSAEVLSTEEALNRINVIHDTILMHEELTSIDALEIFEKINATNIRCHTLCNSALDSCTNNETITNKDTSIKKNTFNINLDPVSDEDDGSTGGDISELTDDTNSRIKLDKEDIEQINLFVVPRVDILIIPHVDPQGYRC